MTSLANPPPPTVEPKLYRRNRIRVKELLSDEFVKANMISQEDSEDLFENDDKELITVCGWTRTQRNANKGQLLFLEISDGSCNETIQCILESGDENTEKTKGFKEAKSSGGTGASFQLKGILVESPASGQVRINILYHTTTGIFIRIISCH